MRNSNKNHLNSGSQPSFVPVVQNEQMNLLFQRFFFVAFLDLERNYKHLNLNAYPELDKYVCSGVSRALVSHNVAVRSF